MNNFIISITTYNRLSYLKELINSWQITKSDNVNWQVIIADDGSTDDTIKYIENLIIKDVEITLIKNRRIGIHQQMNTIISKLEKLDFDICFKVDDDVEFLKKGWDELYYKSIIETGFEHLVFCDNNWAVEQFLEKEIEKENLISKTSILNVHGFFYTLTPNIIKNVGYFNVDDFGFRGMGHVDYTARCCMSGFNDKNSPFDIKNSNEYISASKKNYKSAIKSKFINLYDSHYRKQKEDFILNNNKIYQEYTEINKQIYDEFKSELLNLSLIEFEKLENKINKKDETIDWYKKENKKIIDYYNNRYESLPTWCKKLGKIITKK